MPVDYRALSVPFDPTMDYFDNFLISTSGYLVGGGAKPSVAYEMKRPNGTEDRQFLPVSSHLTDLSKTWAMAISS